MSIFERVYMVMMVRPVGKERADKGAAMVEYGLLVAGIAVVVSGAVVLFGERLTTEFGSFLP